jgi:CheY-like chemotaxis protein
MKTILLADPNSTRLLLEKTCLSRRGHHILEARSGSHGLDLAREHRPTLVFFPSRLGDMDGAAFCRCVREDDRTRNSSLILVVSNDADEAVNRALEAGANDVLILPLQPRDLEHKLSVYLNIETRKTVRVLVQIQIYMAESRGLFMGTSVNLSASGMLLESKADHAVGSRLRMQFYLAGHDRAIETEASVARYEFLPGLRRYGLRFETIGQEDAEAIRRYVQTTEET